MTETPTVDINGLHVRFDRRDVLSNVSLRVNRRESVAVMGPSGVGKSTLLACVLGMIKPHQGSVRVCGTDMAQMNRARLAKFRAERIGMIFQHGELLDDLTAVENVALPSALSTRDPDAWERARTMVTRLGVPDDVIAGNLSGGEYQRVALARALVNHPDLIVADEPTGSLDASLRDVALELLIDAARRQGSAVLLVTHDPAVAERTNRTIRLGTDVGSAGPHEVSRGRGSSSVGPRRVQGERD